MIKFTPGETFRLKNDQPNAEYIERKKDLAKMVDHLATTIRVNKPGFFTKRIFKDLLKHEIFIREQSIENATAKLNIVKPLFFGLKGQEIELIELTEFTEILAVVRNNNSEIKYYTSIDNLEAI